ncbi:MAG: DUF3540 domain-containing protein [Desulfobacteraceae bacterium]|nr:MAG: DUF3540 domain-containing protein [Desulfobacteraceae bacterium]
MENAAKKTDFTSPVMEYGQVLRTDSGRLVVRASCGDYPAETAVSCLIAPHTGDTVLISLDRHGRCYILAVLKRGSEGVVSNELLFTGSVHLHVKNGGFDLSSEAGVSLAAGEELAMVAPKMTLHAGSAHATVESFSYLGHMFSARLKKIKIVAGRAENIFHRLTERLTNTFRYVTEHEEVQTGSTRYLVEETLTMHSKNAMHMAEEMVTINAEQIHLC